VLTGGAGNGEHIVERHRDISEDDLPGGLGERLATEPGRRSYADKDRLVALLAGQLPAVKPMTMALSPASVRSIMTTWSRAAIASVVNNSGAVLPPDVQRARHRTSP
jgi:hypothetical protein